MLSQYIDEIRSVFTRVQIVNWICSSDYDLNVFSNGFAIYANCLFCFESYGSSKFVSSCAV